jgi:hypothetical protein
VRAFGEPITFVQEKVWRRAHANLQTQRTATGFFVPSKRDEKKLLLGGVEVREIRSDITLSNKNIS